MKLKFIFLIMLLCAACAPTISEPVNTAITASPTLQKTETPTATLEPVVTKDPLADAPDGATGIDDEGNFIKKVVTENKNTLIYTWDTERNAWYRSIFTGFFWDRHKEINDDNNEYSKDQLEMYVYIDSSIEGLETLPTMTHKDNTDPTSKANFETVYFTSELLKALKNAGVIKDTSEFNMVRWVNRDFSLPLTNPDGPQQPWGLWPGTTIDVHIRGDYEDLKANTATNGFFETAKSALYGPENNYMLKIWTDTQNNLHVEIAPSLSADKWTEEMLVEMAIIGPGEAFRSADQTHPESGGVTNLFVKGYKTYPYFTFGPPQ